MDGLELSEECSNVWGRGKQGRAEGEVNTDAGVTRAPWDGPMGWPHGMARRRSLSEVRELDLCVDR